MKKYKLSRPRKEYKQNKVKRLSMFLKRLGLAKQQESFFLKLNHLTEKTWALDSCISVYILTLVLITFASL